MMKTAKEILLNKISKDVVFSIGGEITITGKLNANDIVDAMEDYRSQPPLKEQCGLKKML